MALAAFSRYRRCMTSLQPNPYPIPERFPQKEATGSSRNLFRQHCNLGLFDELRQVRCACVEAGAAVGAQFRQSQKSI